MDKLIPKNPVLFGYKISKIHKKWAIPSIIAVLVATGLSKFGVVVLRNLTDAIAANEIDINSVWYWAILYPVLYLVMHLCWRISGFTGMRWFMKMRSTAYQSLYEYLTLHSKDYFNSRFAGSLANKIANAVDGTENLFETTLWEFKPLIIGLLWYIAFAGMSDWRLGIIIALWSLLFLAINMWFSKKLHPYSYKFADSLSTLRGRIVDSLSNISLVQEYAHIAGERKYINRFVKNQEDTGMAHWRFSEIILTINGVLIFLFIFLMIGTSVYLFQHQLISIGVVVMVTVIVTDLASQFLFIGQEMKNAARYYGEAKEGLQEILKEHLIVDSQSASELIATKGEIIFDSINFDYENTNVFKDFTLHIRAGEKVGLVGRSGAGKTTFVSLILRHFDLKKGSISIDGQNISDVKLESLRRSIAFVPQDFP
jgi:ATP-binding cassette, subfamily B, bacterial